MPTAHLISGLPSAGKSTYAQQLQLRTGAVVFTLDRFLITMFGRYAVPDVGGEEHVRRVLACREVIWMSAEKLLVNGSDVILDDGYFLREHRRKVVDAAVALGAAAKIHTLSASCQFGNWKLSPAFFSDDLSLLVHHLDRLQHAGRR
jgi:predicted kinase